MAEFWHRPLFKPRKWHAYYGGDRGFSLCGRLALIGRGVSSDSRQTVPVRGKCGACLKAWRDRRGDIDLGSR